MGISRYQAYSFLDLPDGSSAEAIDRKFRQLARRFCPSESHYFIPEAFKKIVWAYQKLKIGIEDTSMSLDDMMHFTARVCQGEDPFTTEDSHEDEEDEDEYDDFMTPFASMALQKILSMRRLQQEEENNFEVHSSPKSHLDGEVNARDLVEDELENSQAAKRRAKKKRQREKKRQEKLTLQATAAVTAGGKDKKEKDEINNNGVSLSEVQDADKKSALFSTVVKNKPELCLSARQQKKAEKREKKRLNEQLQPQQKQPQEKQQQEMTSEEEEEEDEEEEESGSVHSKDSQDSGLDITSAFCNYRSQSSIVHERKQAETATSSKPRNNLVIESRKLAIKGNSLVTAGQYAEAAILFTQAIDLVKNDCRFYGNRSYCFEQLKEYDRALQDANMATNLSPNWPNAHFRRGSALAGLKLYADAKQSFESVLHLKPEDEDAKHQLEQLKVQQITDMGFSHQDAIVALEQCTSIEDAINNLLAEALEESSVSNASKTKPAASFASISSDVSDKGVKSLWVGNVQPHVTTDELLELFSLYGAISNVHRPHKQTYAFINYYNSAAASEALDELQGVECGGARLRVKVPDNHIASVNKSNTGKQKVSDMGEDECYFWRTTGCLFGSNCRKIHIPEKKGVDYR